VADAAIDDAAMPLLATKLHPPRRRLSVVPRPRLLARLSDHELPALTLVSAAAGFGKTTLVADRFADESATAWLSLDPRDDDPVSFWTYVVAALQTVQPDLGVDARSLLRSPQTSIDAVVAMLLNDLVGSAGDLVLVIDDYHVVTSTEIHDTMAFFLEHLPPHVHLVVVSRADPPFPLAALRARGELVEVRSADLRFTADEATTYLNGTMDLTLTPADVESLERRTEGWIAALQLAALSMQGRDDVASFIAGFAGDDRFIIDYLAGEVLERQTEDVRRFLLETAILNRLTGSLCDAVTDRDDGRAVLDQLDRANLFLIPLDDHRGWYRYHHLFADVLRARLLDEPPVDVGVLHRRASDWFEANGDRAEAIGHAMAGNAFERAAELIERAAPEMRRTRKEATLRAWLEAIPEEFFEDRPVLGIALVGARMSTGDHAGVEELVDMAEQWVGSTGDQADRPTPVVFDREEFARLPAQVAVYRAALALLVGEVDATIAYAERALALVEPTDHLRRGSASALLGLAHWSVGDLESARARYADAVTSLTAADHLADVLGCCLALSDIQIAQGRLDDATETLESGLRLAADHAGLRGEADMRVGLSELSLERNELDDAARHLRESADLGEVAGLPQHAYRWRVATARLRRAEGDLDSAFELLEEAEPLYATDFSPPIRPVSAMKARVQIERGDLAAADRWAAAQGLATGDELSYVREFEHVTLARALLAREESIDDAITLLDRLRVAADDGDRTGSTIEILVLLAIAHQRRGDAAAAVEAIEDALVRAEPQGHVRAFVDEGHPAAVLVQSVSGEGAAARHAQRVLAGFGPVRADPPVSTGLVDDLSPRELDVLRLLRSELSGPDIARELLVSLNTLRTHTKNIYAKLGVNNRREAVRRAAELGL
jgi:LuxR family maltose regulon positive regulatory protein